MPRKAAYDGLWHYWIMTLLNCATASFPCSIACRRSIPRHSTRSEIALPAPNRQSLRRFVDSVNAWLAARLHSSRQELAVLDRIATIWEKFNASARDVDEFNLERKPLVFNIFGWLAEPSRGC